jgi:hypothetical protein
MNENKKEYEIGYVDITTEEYKDLIIEMVENRKDAEYERHLRWKAETELKTVKAELEQRTEELHRAYKLIEELKEVANNG